MACDANTRWNIYYKDVPFKESESTVHFSLDKNTIHYMRVWTYAARRSRKGIWEVYARDCERFKRRIAHLEYVLDPAPASKDIV